MKRILICTGLLIPTLLLAADHLNVKTGLWEMVTVTEMSGVPPIPEKELAALSAAQRAKIMAMYQSQIAAPQTHTGKECLTQEDLDKPFHGTDDKNCKTTVVKTTSTTQDITVACSGETTSSSKMHFEASSPEAVNGTIEMKFQQGGKEMTANSKLKAHWLGAACKKGETN